MRRAVAESQLRFCSQAMSEIDDILSKPLTDVYSGQYPYEMRRKNCCEELKKLEQKYFPNEKFDLVANLIVR